MAFHDDVYMATPPARVGPMYAVVQEELYVRPGSVLWVQYT